MIIDLTNRYIEKLSLNANKTDIETVNDIIKDYYYLYEYSDDINLIVDNPIYPSLLNYVKTGLLTEDEMLQALLYK